MSRLASLGYRAGWTLLRNAPELPSRWGFEVFGELAALRGGRGLARLRDNLGRVTGLGGRELEVLAHRAMRSYATYWLEVFRLPALSAEEVERRWTWQGVAHLHGAYAAGRGVVLALPHMGNWDAAGAWLTTAIGPFTTVAERLEPADLFDRFVAFREGLGMEVIALTGGEQPPFEVLAARLTAGGLVCLLADRDLSSSGVEVTLGDGRVRVPAGPAALALRTGAALLPVTLWAGGGGRWCGEVHAALPASDVVTMTQQLVDVFGAAIRAHPTDWHMLGKVFVA